MDRYGVELALVICRLGERESVICDFMNTCSEEYMGLLSKVSSIKDFHYDDKDRNALLEIVDCLCMFVFCVRA